MEKITVKEAAGILKVSTVRVHHLIRTNRLKVVGTADDGRVIRALLDAAEVREFRNRPPVRTGRPPLPVRKRRYATT